MASLLFPLYAIKFSTCQLIMTYFSNKATLKREPCILVSIILDLLYTQELHRDKSDKE